MSGGSRYGVPRTFQLSMSLSETVVNEAQLRLTARQLLAYEQHRQRHRLHSPEPQPSPPPLRSPTRPPSPPHPPQPSAHEPTLTPHELHALQQHAQRLLTSQALPAQWPTHESTLAAQELLTLRSHAQRLLEFEQQQQHDSVHDVETWEGEVEAHKLSRELADLLAECAARQLQESNPAATGRSTRTARCAAAATSAAMAHAADPAVPRAAYAPTVLSMQHLKTSMELRQAREQRIRDQLADFRTSCNCHGTPQVPSPAAPAPSPTHGATPKVPTTRRVHQPPKSPNPPSVGERPTPPSVGERPTPPSVGERPTPPSVGERPTDQMRMEIRAQLLKNLPRVMDVFRSFDRNGDGRISRSECAQVLSMLGLPQYGAAEMEGMFDALDADRSGTLDFHELDRLLRRGADVQLAAALQVGAKGVIEVEARNRHRLRAHARDGAPETTRGAPETTRAASVDEATRWCQAPSCGLPPVQVPLPLPPLPEPPSALELPPPSVPSLPEPSPHAFFAEHGEWRQCVAGMPAEPEDAAPAHTLPARPSMPLPARPSPLACISPLPMSPLQGASPPGASSTAAAACLGLGVVALGARSAELSAAAPRWTAVGTPATEASRAAREAAAAAAATRHEWMKRRQVEEEMSHQRAASAGSPRPRATASNNTAAAAMTPAPARASTVPLYLLAPSTVVAMAAETTVPDARAPPDLRAVPPLAPREDAAAGGRTSRSELPPRGLHQPQQLGRAAYELVGRDAETTRAVGYG